ncbi:MAG TPA: hypothetical protein VFF86_04165 [Candidatus Methylomirabilis sp.]|nr:hypothetical protein [Candidatus Methylomirabilis sp.]
MTIHGVKQITRDALRNAKTRHPKASHFLWETYRIWPAILIVAFNFWYFERLNLNHEGAEWLRTLAKLNTGAAGVIFAHVSWSLLFPYVRTWTLLLKKPDVFCYVILARAIYYGLVVYGVLAGL